MSFETQTAYLEGRADVTLEVMALVDKAYNNHLFTKGALIEGLREIAGRSEPVVQYDTRESA